MLRAWIISLSFAASAGTSLAGPADVDAVHEFLTTHIENKTLVSPETEFVIEPGRLIGVSARQETMRNVTRRNRRITFQLLYVSSQTNYRLDDQGNRILPGKLVGSAGMAECIFTKRQTAERIFGTCTSLIASGWESTAELRLEGGSLLMTERSAAPFDDGYAANDLGWKPVVITNESTFAVVDGKPVLNVVNSGYDHNLESQTTASEPYTTIRTTYMLSE